MGKKRGTHPPRRCPKNNKQKTKGVSPSLEVPEKGGTIADSPSLEVPNETMALPVSREKQGQKQMIFPLFNNILLTFGLTVSESKETTILTRVPHVASTSFDRATTGNPVCRPTELRQAWILAKRPRSDTELCHSRSQFHTRREQPCGFRQLPLMRFEVSSKNFRINADCRVRKQGCKILKISWSVTGT